MVAENEVSADTQPVMETKACMKCFAPVECEVIEIMGRTLQFDVLCPECQAEYDARCEQERRDADARKAQEAFDAMCPPLYRSSDPKRIPAAFLREIEAWQLGDQGIGLIGPAGTCKTRAAWMLLKRLHFAGVCVYGLTATAFAKSCANQWADNPEAQAAAEHVIERCHSAAVLLLDDMGKQKFTERAETELFALLEYRTSHLLPTIWTANAEKGTLKEMLSPDRGEPILRRLVEFSKVVREEK